MMKTKWNLEKLQFFEVFLRFKWMFCNANQYNARICVSKLRGTEENQPGFSRCPKRNGEGIFAGIATLFAVVICLDIGLVACSGLGNDDSTAVDKTHTVTFNANGGTGAMFAQTIAEDSSATLTANTFTRSGYTFVGWATTPNATNAVWSDGASYTMGTADVILYAVWQSASPSGTTLAELEAGGYITLIDIAGATGGSYVQATSVTDGFVHNISAFSLGKYEVTYELWYTVYQWAIAHDYTFANAGREGNDGTIGAAPTTTGKHEPVTTVNWRDCIVWCNAWSEMTDLSPVFCSDADYTTPIRSSADGSYGSSVNPTAGSVDNPYVNWGATGYRLPTVGEWQYAASCKATYPYDYASGADASCDVTTGGTDIDGDGDVKYTGDVAWYNDNSDGATHAAGTKAANKWGLYDMSGNVREWYFDLYDDSPTTAQTDYTGPSSSSYEDDFRGFCGGSFGYPTDGLCVGGSRSAYPSYSNYFDAGFRVCRRR